MPAATSEQTGQVKPIPAFYCCYLLRSSKRPDSLYIGSTPDPARRLGQHNGFYQGGAKTTKADVLRPWEMVAIVEGFTSRTAALQFEWSWQHMHTTRHINAVETDQLNRRRNKVGKSTDKGSRICNSPIKILGNLHQLLRSDCFRMWPLTVRFLSTDAHDYWQRWTERTDGLLPDSMQIKLDFHSGGASVLNPDHPVNDMTHIDATYNGVKDHLTKSMSLLGGSSRISCEVCKEPLSEKNDIIVVCSQPNCSSTSHIKCLSQLFLDQEGDSQLVPIFGECPACKQHVTWATLMRELSLRLRGGNAVIKRLKTGRKRKKTTQSQKAPKNVKKATEIDDYALDANDNGYDDDDDLDENWINTVNVESSSENSDDKTTGQNDANLRVEIVIEDSEIDDFD